MKTYLLSIPMKIYRLARKSPDKIAVIDSDFKKYTYRTLNGLADSIMNMFPQKDSKRIGILCSPGINQIASVLAVVKSGAAYVPLDPALNGSSLRKFVAQAHVDFVITDDKNEGRLGDTPVLILPENIEIDSSNNYIPLDFGKNTIACAMIDKNGRLEEISCIDVRKHARYLCDEFEIKGNDIVLQSAVVSSSMFLAEVFATMMKGASLAILPEKNRGYAKAIADFAERAGVTIICGYKPMMEDLGLLKSLPSRLRMLLSTAGDRLSNTLSGFHKKGWKNIFTARKFQMRHA